MSPLLNTKGPYLNHIGLVHAGFKQLNGFTKH